MLKNKKTRKLLLTQTCKVSRKNLAQLQTCEQNSTTCCMPSVLWRCWLGGRKGIRPVKNWVVRCWHGYLSGARCRLACTQLMPLPLTVSCFSKIQIGFTFLVPAHPGSPGHRAVERVCVCVCAVCNKFLPKWPLLQKLTLFFRGGHKTLGWLAEWGSEIELIMTAVQNKSQPHHFSLSN